MSTLHGSLHLRPRLTLSRCPTAMHTAGCCYPATSRSSNSEIFLGIFIYRILFYALAFSIIILGQIKIKQKIEEHRRKILGNFLSSDLQCLHVFTRHASKSLYFYPFRVTLPCEINFVQNRMILIPRYCRIHNE